MKKKHVLALSIGASVLAVGAITPAVIFATRAGDNETQQIEVEDDVKLVSNLFNLSNLRAKVSSLAPVSESYSSSEKGLLIYGYESGGVASYKQLLSGSTTFRSIANSKDKITPNLTHYSYKVTDVNTGESFKIHVLTGEKVTTYYVEADGKVAGESYFSSANGMVTHGYSKLFNNSGTYTKVTSTGSNIDSKITFNPADMSVVVEGQTKSFEVWNFKEDYIDGKGQIKHLDSFKNYKVEIVFEEMIANSKAELVLYEIGNKKFDGAILNNSTTLFADLSLSAIINKPYELPTPVGENPENVEVWVYKEGANEEPIEVMHGKLNEKSSFTPDSIGKYYIRYKTNDGELRDKISVIASESTSSSLDSNILDSTDFGYRSTITVPNLAFTSNRSSNELGSLVTIKLGDKVLVENRKPGFEFSFNHHDKTTEGLTEYTFIYKCENSNISEEVVKKVNVNSANGVCYFEPYLSDYSLESTLPISKGIYYIDGQEFVCDVDIIYPASSKIVKHSRSEFDAGLPQLLLDESGLFTVRYHNDEKGANINAKFRAMPRIDKLFSAVDATVKYGNSSSSDINKGVIGSFKEDGTLTYNNVIDATTLTKDKKLISFSAQPKVPGTAELNHIYVSLEDVTNPDNYFEVRMSQGADNVIDKTFIRALANGQAYGGYYYNSWFDISSDVAIDRYFRALQFGTSETKSFNKFVCTVESTVIGGVTKMSFRIDHEPKNLHFVQTDVTLGSFESDINAFLKEFNDQISKRMGDGRLTKADVGEIHDPEITWQSTSAHDQGGFLHEHSFTGEMDTYSFEEIDYIDLYYDNEDKALYTNFWYHVAGYAAEARVVKICDFDDPETYGADKVWNGFKSNNVKLSIRATGVSGDSGDVLIREVCGNKFDGELLGDTDNPIIDVADGVIPNAKVGTPFKPLDVVYKDLTSAVETKEITVKDPDDQNVPLVDGKFTPSKEGEYKILYTARDSFDNESTFEMKITAKDPSFFNPFESKLNVEDGKEVQYGVNYKIPDPEISGGCGRYEIIKTATITDAGGTTKPLEVVDGKVRVLHSGTYTITVKSVDYLGEEKTDTFTFTSQFSSDPIYEGHLVLPERLFKGVPYELDHFTVDLFEKEGEEQKTVDVKARVTDASGTHTLSDNLLYTPDCSASVHTAHVELFVTVGDVDIVVDETTVEVFDLSNTNYVLEGYFINSENVSTEGFFGCILYTTEGEPGDISTRFVYPISVDALSLTFSQYATSGKNRESKSNLKTFVVTLTDFENPDITFDIVYAQKENGVFVTLPNNSISEYKVANSFTDVKLNGSMGFSFKPESNSVIDVSGSTVGKISKCSNGAMFNGFTSGKALISIKATDVEADNGFFLNNLSNIVLDYSKTDNKIPSLNINGSYGGYVREGETVTLPSATAYDVLSYCGTPTLSVYSAETKEYVKDVNGLVMKDVPTNREYSIAFEKYGEYTVVYSVSDSAGNVNSVDAFPYRVTDSDPATLTFSNVLANENCEVSLFSSLNLCEYSIHDNAGSEGCYVSIYAVLPTSEVVTVKTEKYDSESGSILTTYNEKYPNGTFVFTGKGNYQIIYLVTDSNGNISAVTKTVVVK